MKQSCKAWQWVRAAAAGIHPVDRCLILFMFILLLQSFACLFFPPGSAGPGSAVDTAVRTSSSAIFGYFLSAKFAAHAPANPSQEGATGKSGKRPPALLSGGRLQIAVAGGIGLFCLLALAILRGASLWAPSLFSSDSAAATVSQFRDFISGCVGFLISNPSGAPPQSKQ